MKQSLQEILFTKYPKLFDVSDETRSLNPFPMFGIECGNGWFNIIDCLCGSIQSQIDWSIKRNDLDKKWNKENPENLRELKEPFKQVIVTQVKEKFGSLRFYYDYGNDKIDAMVSLAESLSAVTCECCGSPGKMRGKSWLYTACDLHTREEDKQNDNSV